MKKTTIILKSIINFFLKNVFSIIGIIMLVIFSSSTFVTLNNANNNLNYSYQKVVKEGNLHDLVINERFILGSAQYNFISSSYVPNNPSDPNGPGEYSFKLSPVYDIDNNIGWTHSYKKIYNKFQIWKDNDKPLHEIFTQNSNLFEETKYYLELPSKPIDLNNNEYIQNKIQENLLKLEKITSSFIPNNFISDIENEMPVYLRNYKSIDIPTNNFFYKVIESQNNYNIDNIVLFDGHELSSSDDSYINLFSYYSNLTGDKLSGIDLGYKIIKILSDTSWSDNKVSKNFIDFFNFLNEKNDPSINPWTVSTQPFSSARLGQENFKLIINKKYFNEKGFSIVFDVKKLIPFTGLIEEKSSYESIVTPEYLKTHNKKIFPYEKWIIQKEKNQENFISWFENELSNDFKIKIDNIDYVIIGSGISPDFMYPIISNERIIPNLEEEAIFYTNNAGFLKIQDSFRNSNIESMILGKFDFGVSNKEEIISEINYLSKSLMDWPENMQAAFFANDTNNIITPTALRVIFIPNIMNTITLVSYFLTSFIVFVSTIIIIFFIKRFIELNKVNLAILQANGYKKKDIIIPMIIGISILVFIGSIIGFNLGLILQIPAILLFDSFWTLPITLSSFNLLSFLIFVIIFVSFYVLISLFIVIFFLKGDNVSLMKNDSQFKENFLIKNPKKIFNKMNPLNKFRISLAYYSISKLLILSIMTSLIMTSIVFVSSTFNSFSNSISSSFNSKDYKYDIKLFSPTNVSGQYYGVPIDNMGMTLIEGKYVNSEKLSSEEINNSINNLLTLNDLDNAYKSYKEIIDINYPNISNPAINLLIENGNLHLPSINDINRQSTILFLKNMTQNKALLDVSIIGNNPWSISSRLMPVNQKNYADDSFRKIFSATTLNNSSYPNIVDINNLGQGKYNENTIFSETLLKFSKNSNINNLNSFKNEIIDNNNDNDYLEIDASKIINSNSIINSEFLTFILNLFQIENIAKSNYSINFNKIPLLEFDETYTYVDFNINSIDKINKNSLKGISEETKFIKLLDENGNNLIDNLKKFKFSLSDKIFPIIINKFASNKFNLKKDDVFEVNVLNNINRYDKLPNESNKFVVIGINNTFQTSEFYTLQSYANILTGMDTFKYSHNLADEPFNAIMTQSESLVQIDNSISSYSPSGLYIGGDRFSASSFLEILSLPNKKYEYMKEAAKISNIDIPNTPLGINDAIKFRDQLINKYGDSVYVSILDNILSIQSLNNLANDISNTASFIQLSITLIVVIISIIIITLIIFMLILDSLKIAGMIKILGLKNFSNAFSFIFIYFIAVFLGIIISIPLSYFVNFIYINLILNTGNILLIAPITILDYFIASLSLLIFFIISFSLNWIKIKKLDLTKTIK